MHQFGRRTMPNEPLFSSGATNREPVQETRGATPVRMSIRGIPEQKLNQLGRYIRAAYSNDEPHRWKSFKEPR